MKNSYLVASGLALVIVGWMAVGQIRTPADADPETRPAVSTSGSGQMTVAVRLQAAENVIRHIVAQGQVEPSRVVTVRAETAGQIAEVLATQGRPIGTKDVLARIEMNDRAARLSMARALSQERQRAYDAAKRLGKSGHQSRRRIDDAFSLLQTARAELEQIEIEIKSTTIRAPFDGLLETRRVEVGDYVAINGEIAVIVDNDPLIVAVQIAQRDIGRVARETAVELTLATGQNAAGTVRAIAPRADSATRTFRVEIEVPNPGNRIRSGTSAEARIPTGTVSAHFISPALLTLDESGRIGVKTVTEANVVAFHPVSIVLAAAKGVWVSGLPEEARIITVGQGFVRNGETVRIAPEGGGGGVSVVSQVMGGGRS